MGGAWGGVQGPRRPQTYLEHTAHESHQVGGGGLDKICEMMARERRCEHGEDSELRTGFHCAVHAEAAEGGGRHSHVRHGSPGRGRRRHRSGEVVLVDVLLLLLVALLVLADGGRRRGVV